MNPLIPILAQAGISVFGKALAGAQQPPMPTMEWGAERAKFSHFLREQLIPQREEAIRRLRLEAARSGTAMGGAYLEGVTGIMQKGEEIFGREISRFEIEQSLAQRQWGQQMAMLRYQRGQEKQQLTESIFGTLAAVPGQIYGAQQQQEVTQAITAGLPTGQAQQATGLLNPMNLLVLSQLALKSGDIEQMKLLLERAMKSFGGAVGPAGHPTAMPQIQYGTVQR